MTPIFTRTGLVAALLAVGLLHLWLVLLALVTNHHEVVDMLQPLGHTGPQYDATRCTPPQ